MSYTLNGLGASTVLDSNGRLIEGLNARWAKMAQASPIALSLASLATIEHALQLLHQAAHWQTRGPSYYADHLLFQRLYKPIDKEIDALGERAVGLGDPRLVCPITTADTSAELLQSWGKGHGLDSPTRLLQISLGAERALLLAVEAAMKMGSASDGVQNLLQGIADTHEGNVYLLQQRLVRGA